ncbi:MAG: archaeosine synthase subunit alpha [Methanoregulaceae archaeon]|jgi:archaeosine synthase
MIQIDIRKRDGLARSGTFVINKVSIRTPAVLDTVDLFPSLKTKNGTNIPLAAGSEFTKSYYVKNNHQPITIHPALENPALSGDCVMVDNWHTVLYNPRNYVMWLIDLKEKTPPDTLWYVPATALPSNVHILCYSGFDIFDFRAVDLKSAQGIFCLPEGEFPKEYLKLGLCTCDGCRNENLKQHNRIELQCEIELINRFIEAGQLRELVESRSRMHAQHVAILRHLDNQYNFMEKRVPVSRSCVMQVNSGESINRVEIRRFAERVVTRYIPPKTDVAVLLPCSAKKPYSLSKSHRKFQTAIANRAHELIISSPLGIVPREVETIYPAGHYDVPVTGYWDAEECSLIADIIARYFIRNRYRRIIAHLDGGALKVVEIAAEKCNLTLEYSCKENPTSNASLNKLDQALDGERRIKDDRLHGMCSYQFGIDINTKGFTLRGRFPEIYYSKENLQYFSINTATGMLRPTFDGWKLIPKGYRVLIDDFTPEGDILVPGIIKADPEIREGDEVLIIGLKIEATGKAAMSEDEMMRSKRGVAVRVRKIKKL